ncbi:hypothetical protein ABFS83_02G008400 [Erythranthe nasuta]
MAKSNHQDDLDLLLSLEERVLETPPASPSGYLSDDGVPKRTRHVDMSVFRDVVNDCLDYVPENAKKSNQVKSSKEIEVEKFSGLRIHNPLLSRVELSNHLSDIRFVQLPAIKNVLMGDTLSGCWVTIGVLMEKGVMRTSAIGQPFTIWKMGCLDENTISLFLFADAFQRNRDEEIGAVFALFNCSVRKDKLGKGSTLSVFNAKHILKLGTSADMGICQGKGNDGACTTVINKRRRKYCSYHSKNSSNKYTSTRAELKGGNLKTGVRNYLKSEGIYVVKPTDNGAHLTKSTKPVKLMSVEGLKNALKNADKVTTNTYSQGIRFLNHLTGQKGPEVAQKQTSTEEKRRLPRYISSKEPVAKKPKTEPKKAPGQDTKNAAGIKMIELDFSSSDDEVIEV